MQGAIWFEGDNPIVAHIPQRKRNTFQSFPKRQAVELPKFLIVTVHPGQLLERDATSKMGARSNDLPGLGGGSLAGVHC